MKHRLEPVQFPEQDLHVLFRISLAGQDPLPVIRRFLRRALREGIVDGAAVIGRMPTPLGHAAILEDGRLRAFVFVQWNEKTYATPYTMFPSRSRMGQWFRLAREMGDARLMGTRAEDLEGGGRGGRGMGTAPRGMRWCPACEGLNPGAASRCIWCRRHIPEGEEGEGERKREGGTPVAALPGPAEPPGGRRAP